MREISMPASFASRLASGEAKTRSPRRRRLRRGLRFRRGGWAGAASVPRPWRLRCLRLRRWGGRLRLRRGGASLAGAGGGRLHVLALAGQHRDHLVDRHVGGAFRHHDLGDGALVDRLDLHRRLVGLDLGDDVAGLDRVAFLLQPLGKVALLHRGRQRRHENVDRHGSALLPGGFFAIFLAAFLAGFLAACSAWRPSPAARPSRRRTPRRSATVTSFLLKPGFCAA